MKGMCRRLAKQDPWPLWAVRAYGVVAYAIGFAVGCWLY